jgi:hypothetical protein
MMMAFLRLLQMQPYAVFIKCPDMFDMFDVDCEMQSDVI